MSIISFKSSWQASAKTVVELIQATRLDLSDEKRTQLNLADALKQAGIGFEREVRLSPADIVDFMVSGVAIEVKLKGSRKMDVYRQLVRYAEHDSVKAIVLATNLTMGLPAELDGKPVYFVSLARAWL